MKFTETKLKGLFAIEPEPKRDARGFFTRSWCADEFKRHGLEARSTQGSISFNEKKGTIRGLHFQLAPHAETKLIRCTAGAIYDVLVDIRPSSPTYKQWVGMELTAENRTLLYVPDGFAHGFQTLTDNAEVYYEISVPFSPESARGIRWDDAILKINWPLPVSLISDRDKAWPPFGKS